ncbi:MAG: hypothetical protein R3C62_08715 [Chloroflexota bacterium]
MATGVGKTAVLSHVAAWLAAGGDDRRRTTDHLSVVRHPSSVVFLY